MIRKTRSTIQKVLKGIVLFTKGMIPFYFFIACSDSDKKIVLQWEEGKATAITIPQRYLEGIPDDSIHQLVTIHLKNPASHPAMFGIFFSGSEGATFQPLVPFTPGLQYEIRIRNKSLEQISVPLPDAKNVVEVLNIYPTQDTLPHNVLKFYISFSQPMTEGRALQHITLMNDIDTVEGSFLDLRPELWNQDRTMLTLWLDPGRIKRDLQPNKMLGTPLNIGQRYRLIVEATWKDSRGLNLARSFSREFVVVKRDSLSPAPEKWKMQTPKAGSTDPLTVNFYESLDYALLNEAVWIADEKGDPVRGRIEIDQEERSLSFVPERHWVEGAYAFECETRLEDLAGNNLNRPFDNDLSQVSEKKSQKTVSVKFHIE